MRALRHGLFGGPEVLSIDDVPEPVRRPGELLVEVHAAGLGFSDTERRRGLTAAGQPLPATLGQQGAGVIVNADDSSLVGRRVAFRALDAQAERCVVTAREVLFLPDEVPFPLAAMLPVHAVAAWHLVHTLAKVQASDTVLIHSAAGALGQLLVQLAVETGARVIGTVSREAKAAVVRELGAHEVLVRGPDLQVPETSVVLEALGPDAVMHAARLAPLGRWVHAGSTSGQLTHLELAPFAARSATLQLFSQHTPLPEGLRRQAEQEVLARAREGRLRLQVTTVPLEHAARAHRRLEAGLTTGAWVFTLR